MIEMFISSLEILEKKVELESCRVWQRVMKMAQLEGAGPSMHLNVSMHAIG